MINFVGFDLSFSTFGFITVNYIFVDLIFYWFRWENDVVGMVEQTHRKHKISVSFECETLKAENAAEEHIKKFMPNVSGLNAVGNYHSLNS